MASWPRTEQEEKLEAIFNDLAKTFKKIKKSHNPDKIHGMLKSIGTGLKEGKALIKEFEFEARTDGMPAPLLAERKRELVNQINGFIAMKKEVGEAQSGRSALISGAAAAGEENLEGMSMQQLIKKGHKEIDEIDQGLHRAERIANDTIDIGTQAAAALNDQTDKLNKIVDDLNEIEFTMKKASKVIGDITRGLLTDKCIGFLLFLVAGGVVGIIILKIVKPNSKAIASSLCSSLGNVTGANCTQIINSAKDLANGALNQLESVNVGRRFLIDKAIRTAVAIMQEDDDSS